MDLKEIQDLLKGEKGKIIIVENGEPLMVILPYEEYKKKGSGSNADDSGNGNGNGISEPLPEEIPDSQSELTIDDLPL